MKNHIPGTRRDFIKNATILSAAAPIMPHLLWSQAPSPVNDELQIHLFSKHFQFLNYEEMAEKAAEMGFDGLDLTVRRGGHVEPEHVEQELPKAVKAMNQAGLQPVLMATNVNDAGDELSQRVLRTAADQGITHYRMQYYRYLEDKTIPESIVHYQHQAEKLAKLNQKLGLMGCYQNHAGIRMGSSIWELYALIMNASEKGLGAQYDIRHATVEGGLNWSKGLQLIHPRIQSFVIKDFKWMEKDGKWFPQNVPFGEGMVEWKTYFQLLKSYGINVPVSLHLEYPLGGAEKGRSDIEVEPQVVYDAMKRDLNNVRKLWAEV
ncbi:sugar phosphate isomerase/epimerase [Membranicola marinus]|uniref:Sugar phosphate isomerase/epimerase n=1 Tax=Membranihabitans marinus TaxID=1227546 RepID=A0A953HT96_9BACT|nr:TIM barrel protein [Membranihabitans marinus]MBY5958010.1 sugar phosphate isomerase/epimerase [Membranihabitans marinus]